MEKFISAARNVGADVQVLATPEELVAYIAERVDGSLMVSSCPSLLRADVPAKLKAAGLDLVDEDFRSRGVIFVEELDEVPDDQTVVFSAHGIAPAVRD